jgi:alpha-beta hydrolase superfamily lysophospholipase
MFSDCQAKFVALFLGGLVAASSALPARAVESTMPPQYIEAISPQYAQQYVYTENGDSSTASGLPTYHWMPADGKMKALIIGIHGLTLHGRRYRVLARTMAVNKIGFIAMDMYGFGRNRFEEDGKLKPKEQGKTNVDHEASYQAIVKLVQYARNQYKGIPLMLMGESLGCSFCMRIAGEHPELVDSIILSAPAVKVNPDMYAAPKDIKAGLKAVVTPGHQVNLRSFFIDLVSNRPEVQNEMTDDPFIVKALGFKELISTDAFVDKTIEWAKLTSPFLPMLVIQGSNDKCVLPKHLTDMLMNMRSNDMRISWKGSYGHLQLETMFMRASIIDSIGMWLMDHGNEGSLKLKKLEQDIADMGGTLVR